MTNVGTIDRGIRFVVGLLLVALCFLPPSTPVLGEFGAWTWVALAIGGVLIITAIFKFCPAYQLIGVSTCSHR
jgi:uncharacterized membrane protein